MAVLQNRPQEWADALKLGFGDGLREEGYEVGEDVIVVTRSATGDPQGLSTLARAISSQGYRLVFSLGTQASQEMTRVTEEMPVVFGAVTDPVAAGLVSSLDEKRKENVTGTQDLWPYGAQIDLVVDLVGPIDMLGILYNSSEINSQVSVQEIREEAEKRGVELVERTITEDSQVSLATEGLLAAGVDAIFIPADNTVQSAANVVIETAMRQKVPVFTGIPGIVEIGALGTVGTNYYELGKVNARQAAAILQGTMASEIPISTAERGDLYLNLASADELGITVPPDLIEQAVETYP